MLTDILEAIVILGDVLAHVDIEALDNLVAKHREEQE